MTEIVTIIWTLFGFLGSIFGLFFVFVGLPLLTVGFIMEVVDVIWGDKIENVLDKIWKKVKGKFNEIRFGLVKVDD